MTVGGVMKISTAIAFMAMASAHGQTFTVSKDGRGQFTTIQEAVTKAKKGIVEILDAATYAEQVTIDSNNNGLILRSTNPGSLVKPVIQFWDKVNVGPTTAAESKIESKINFDQNGALRIMRARNITIDGIAVDGAGPHPFAYAGIWNSKDPLFHGNAAITVWISGDVVIRNCDVRNAYIGINVKDRNEGGIFANANPADIQPWNVVPLSGFGKTGNHIFEKNRIHNNSWGMFFESAWDLGSNIRYNLLYENHHTATLATQVAGMPDGGNQPGGAIFLKDDLLSPLAIYNNTFWHNHLVIAAHWQAGAQHLVFNNIFGEPYQYWAAVTNAQTFMDLDPVLINRTKHCLWATQQAKPETRSQVYNAVRQDTALNKTIEVKDTVTEVTRVNIMNGMDKVDVEGLKFDIIIPLSSGPVAVPQNAEWVIRPGAKIVGGAGKPYPADANVRWLETKFKSKDPISADFLTPDWDDSLVQKFVKDAGWPEAGIRDADGSIADIGAISMSGSPKEVITVKPLSPVIINGTSATISFSIIGLVGKLENPKIKMLGWQNLLTFQKDVFGSAVLPLPESMNMLSQAGAAKIEVTGSTFTLTVPARGPADYYAFAEIILEGTSSTGQTITTDVGFLPFRKLDYKFLVQVVDDNNVPLTSIKVGQQANLKITPQGVNGTPFANKISPVSVSLNSGADILTSISPMTPLTFPDGITGTVAKPIIFTKVPVGGLEFVTAAGVYTQGTNSQAFFGVSSGIKILTGDPAKIVFLDPPSKSTGVKTTIDPGVLYPVKVEVRDVFDNIVDAKVPVTLTSDKPDYGNVDGPATSTTDSAGVANFKVKVTGGDLNQEFELKATVAGGFQDLAVMKVGQARDRLWILYADTVTFSANTELHGVAGERLRVTVRAGKTPDVKLADRVTVFQVTATPGLAVFASPTDVAQANTFTLVNGEAVIYVTGTMPVSNGILTVTPTVENTIVGTDRNKIFFTFSPFSVASAACYADNGFAAVDRAEFLFSQDLKRAPDSIRISWPGPGLNLRTVSTGITLDPANPRHVTLRLSPAFPAELSSGTGPGTVYSFDPATPDIPVQAASFTAVDGVGPLLDSAKVFEKIEPGAGDTLFVAINEATTPNTLSGASLVLIKKSGGAPIVLAVLSPTENPRAGGTGRGFRIALADLGAQSPEAGDSLRINGAGPLTDISGNHAHVANRPVVLSLRPTPRPPVLMVRMDKPLQGVENQAQTRDFLVLAANPDASWTPVQGSVDRGHSASCTGGGIDCGGSVAGDATGAIDRPAFTVETDRAMKYSITLFTNLGEFVNGFSGEITNAQLGLDDRNLPIDGAPAQFRRGTEGRFQIKISWNARAHNGGRTGTGVYLAKVNVVSQAEDADGKPFSLSQSRVIRFGLMRH